MEFRAVLIDVYETALSCDFAAHAIELPALTDVDGEVWTETIQGLAPEVSDGRISMFDAYAEVLRRVGAPVPDGRVHELVKLDHQLLLANSRLYEDTVPFLEMLRRRGVLTAFVSNCAENTRPLLGHLGLIDLVDAVVLSCEVGAVKPDPVIYEHALRELDVAADTVVLIDDQDAYCDGATAVGIHAIRMCRSDGAVARHGRQTVASLADLADLAWTAVTAN